MFMFSCQSHKEFAQRASIERSMTQTLYRVEKFLRESVPNRSEQTTHVVMESEPSFKIFKAFLRGGGKKAKHKENEQIEWAAKQKIRERYYLDDSS